MYFFSSHLCARQKFSLQKNKENELNVFFSSHLCARINLLLSYSHGRIDEYEEAYFHITQANNKADKPQIDWLEYAFSLAMKLNNLNDAQNLSTRLLFLQPEKKKYWNQASALYFAKDFEPVKITPN